MLLYKNGRIYNIESQYGENRHELLLRAWYLVNGNATKAESLAWSFNINKNCQYHNMEIITEKAKNFTK